MRGSRRKSSLLKKKLSNGESNSGKVTVAEMRGGKYKPSTVCKNVIKATRSRVENITKTMRSRNDDTGIVKKNENSVRNKIAIVGAGAFGCAVYSAIRDVDGNDIAIFFKEKRAFKYAVRRRRHNKMNIDFGENTLLADNLSFAVKGRKYIFLSSPFSVTCDVVHNIQKIVGRKAEIVFVVCCKGMLSYKPFLLYDFIEEKMPNASVAILSGPSFADEMVDRKRTIVSVSCRSRGVFDELSSIFDPFVMLRYCSSPEAIEILGAMKNIIAIYVGYRSMKSSSTNESIHCILSCIDDVKRLFTRMKIKTDLLLEPAGIGDIMLTCLCRKSRNRTFGELLAERPKRAFKYLKKTTVEGYDALKSMLSFCEYKNIHLRTLEELNEIIESLNVK